MKNGTERILWFSWVVVLMMLIALLITRSNSYEFILVDLFAFAALTTLTAVMPIKYRTHMITVFQWVTLVIFLKFGLVLELLVTQFVLFGALYATGLNKTNFYRIPLNSLIFLLTSLLAACVFFLFGGQTNQPTTLATYNDFAALIAYVLTFLVANHFLIYLVRRYLFALKRQQFFKGVLIELATAALFFPLTIILIISYEQMGINAIGFAGLTFIGITIVLQLYNQSTITNHLLKEVTKFGYELNACLTREELFEQLSLKLNAFFNWNQLLLYEVNNEKVALLYAEDQKGATVHLQLRNGESYSRYALESNSLMVAGARKEWGKLGKELPQNLESIIAIPLRRKQEIVGLLTITSLKQRSFRGNQIMILEIMANMLSIALTNVKSFEKTKQQSEHCPLTNLFNFRYFEERLKATINQEKEQPVSLILLDLDHFKKVNDTYGHQSGNDVLCGVADRLKRLTPIDGVVARYGGEEFVILLPNTTEEEATFVARDIWDELRTHPFVIQDDLTDAREIEIIVTASIGVATSSINEENNMDDAVTLIRKADRAMYNGAKQQGRDKVASFNEMKKIPHF
ncbi:diguanylate cyclase [Alkalihalophilus lindianensis]|uniref:Diguanylate cyclase n=1 Tax=Alkalihalophilus lindianensis TaxID=1630542 RepID=A0ABU3XB92_9BACI|nr:diguanylate cyclase [Alkalihalophilus lindianensis]MDV2684887.1 diguanylate cyclase [Alkalihalophilus lindianensis]